MEKVYLDALDALHAAAKSVGFVIEGDDLDTAQCRHFRAALHNAYPAMAAELRALREERDSLQAELAAAQDQALERKNEQDLWARMRGPLVHCGNATSTGKSTAIELHAKQLSEALETLNHAAKVAISSQYGSSFDEDTPLVIRLLDGTCDATDAVLAATPANSLAAHDAALLELAAAREDSARLDWLLPVLSLEDGDGDARAISLANQVMRKAMDTTITARAAIDAARKGESNG